jgi:diaminopimelate epimerase
MEVAFHKYHGAGNDFILLDNRKKKYSKLSSKQIAFLCDRHFGIGADGLVTLNKTNKAKLEMKYFNADGGIGSMCGNGSRCFVLFARQLKLIIKDVSFKAYDGIHKATILKYKNQSAEIKVSMNDVNSIEKTNGDLFLNTGSPHHVKFVKSIEGIEVVTEGRKIRNNSTYKKEGTNVNFVAIKNDKIFIRTYERGVEDETLACGTGITASALAAHYAGKLPKDKKEINVVARGGNLKVSFQKNNKSYNNIYLSGPAEFVYTGTVKI